ncbi:MAG: L-threonylcarbamoyladenylate synthase [Alphaproteobacteria bacterium]|nr:L-threonylcarbamoyladenylate synthase [Alphaproteobacteria bacterium]
MNQLENPDFVNQLNVHLAAGGVIAFPTDTVWGLGALPIKEGAEALWEIKQRPPEKHLIVMSNSTEHLLPFMYNFSDRAIKLGKKHWPGALTIVGNNDPIFGSVRIPNHSVFAKLCGVIDGNCLATTSANISGQPVLQSADAIRNVFPDIIVIEDNGIRPAGIASTVIRVTGDDMEILRQGAISV